jgi:nucleotide-binding universal stress UspA family protein
MHRVLLPLDTSESRTAAQVDAVASLPGAEGGVETTLLHVFDDRETAESTSIGQLPTGSMAQDSLRTSGIRVETATRFGDPAEQILRAADEIDADMIVLGGRKRSPLGSLLFGSVSQAVTLDATRPVVITGGSEEAEASEGAGAATAE